MFCGLAVSSASGPVAPHCYQQQSCPVEQLNYLTSHYCCQMWVLVVCVCVECLGGVRYACYTNNLRKEIGESQSCGRVKPVLPWRLRETKCVWRTSQAVRLTLMMRTVYLDEGAGVRCHLMPFVCLFQAEARGERTERKVSRNCFGVR